MSKTQQSIRQFPPQEFIMTYLNHFVQSSRINSLTFATVLFNLPNLFVTPSQISLMPHSKCSTFSTLTCDLSDWRALPILGTRRWLLLLELIHTLTACIVETQAPIVCRIIRRTWVTSGDIAVCLPKLWLDIITLPHVPYWAALRFIMGLSLWCALHWASGILLPCFIWFMYSLIRCWLSGRLRPPLPTSLMGPTIMLLCESTLPKSQKHMLYMGPCSYVHFECSNAQKRDVAASTWFVDLHMR